MCVDFEIKVSSDRMTGELHLKDSTNGPSNITSAYIYDLLKAKGITFGILQDTIHKLSNDIKSIQFPIQIARGKAQVNGKDGFFQRETQNSPQPHDLHIEHLNFREVTQIDNVKEGQLLATYIEPGPGIEGIDIFGNKIPYKKGTGIRLIKGKNTKIIGNQYFATISGQVSFQKNTVHVYDVFQVNGDLDMRIGNIDFVGSVIITGSVGPGFLIKAGGDVVIHGLVEGSTIISGGNVRIYGGYLGNPNSRIETKGSLTAAYLNHGHVVADRDILIENSIIQSDCTSSGKIFCQKGHIYGGSTSCLEGLEVQSVGNELFVKTNIYLGVDQKYVKRDREIQQKLINISDSLSKLELIVKKLLESKRLKGGFSKKEEELLERQKNTYSALLNEKIELEEERVEIEDKFTASHNASLICHVKIYPNVQVNFGKYLQTIKVPHSRVRMLLDQYEIKIFPLA